MTKDNIDIIRQPPIKYRYENGRIVTEHGSFGFAHRDMTPNEALSFLSMLPNDQVEFQIRRNHE